MFTQFLNSFFSGQLVSQGHAGLWSRCLRVYDLSWGDAASMEYNCLHNYNATNGSLQFSCKHCRNALNKTQIFKPMP